jgi:hypothetical protein
VHNHNSATKRDANTSTALKRLSLAHGFKLCAQLGQNCRTLNGFPCALGDINDDNQTLDLPKLTFKCGSPTLELDSKISSYPTKRVHNKDLINSIKNQFCSLNKKGIWIPKADFTMNNQQDDTSSRIA